MKQTHCLASEWAVLPSCPVHCETAACQTHVDVERQEARCRVRPALQRFEVADITPNDNKGDKGSNKRGQDQCQAKYIPARTEDNRRRIMPNTLLEWVIDGADHGCHGWVITRRAVTLLWRIFTQGDGDLHFHIVGCFEGCIIGTPVSAMHKEQQRQDTGCRHSHVATTSSNTKHDNYLSDLGSQQSTT